MTHAYPRFTRDQVLFDLPSAEGWAWYSWALENEPWSNLERTSTGYVGQQIDAMI